MCTKNNWQNSIFTPNYHDRLSKQLSRAKDKEKKKLDRRHDTVCETGLYRRLLHPETIHPPAHPAFRYLITLHFATFCQSACSTPNLFVNQINTHTTDHRRRKPWVPVTRKRGVSNPERSWFDENVLSSVRQRSHTVGCGSKYQRRIFRLVKPLFASRLTKACMNVLFSLIFSMVNCCDTL